MRLPGRQISSNSSSSALAAGSTATVPLRQMASGANRLAYFLYTNVGLTTVWGAGAASRAYTGTGVIPGVAGKADINVFNGSESAWKKWVKTNTK